MEEEEVTTTRSNNRTVLLLLGVIVLLLVGVITYVLINGGGGKSAGGTDTTGNTGNTGNTGTTNTPAAAPFDPKTATAVADGMTPEEHVKKYFDAVVAADYTTAFKLLPTAKQQEYGDEATFTSQLQGYGITGYTIDSSNEAGDEWTVQATATMAGGNFSYLWTFVKDGDKWLVKSRTLPGMQ